MKKLLIAIMCLVCGQTLFSQAKFGIRVGLSSTDLASKSISIADAEGINNLMLDIKDADYGYHVGIFFQAGQKIFIQPEVLFNSSTVNYNFSDNTGTTLTPFKETYHDIDIPVMFGFRAGPLRLQGGPVGHVHINSSSELTDIAGYKEKFDTFTWGYQTGLGLDIGNKLVLDVKYEGNLSKFGEHLNFFGRDYSFDTRVSRFVASVGWAF